MTRVTTLLLAFGLLASSCFSPTYREGIYCSEEGTCPADMQCNPVDNRCYAELPDAACDDGLRNGDETDTDCGGSCGACNDGLACDAPEDCQSQVCTGNVCAVPECGDGVSNRGDEECDDGGESATCNADCTLATCGDGQINQTAGEECDDAGESAQCDTDCTAAECGDGVANGSADELCDDGGPSANCNADCTLASCGDGVINSEAGEECDDMGESATCDANCTSVACGDSTTNGTAGEECDDGGESAACDTDCTAAQCGDGTINATAGEGCDDSGESATCNANCTIASCGDGTLNTTAGETCDDMGESVTCDADCTAATCGDGTVNMTASEACDDAGESAACDSDCTTAMCGDGTVNATAGESCDDSGESATCDADCTAASCGDGTVNMTASEACDDAGESVTCDADCTAASCGDGTVNTTAGEFCDTAGESAICDADCSDVTCGDGTVNNSAGETCDDMGESATCDDDCTAAACGDSTINATAGEECDDGGESAACNNNCTAAACGDGILNSSAGEECDDGNDAVGDGCSAICEIESFVPIEFAGISGISAWHDAAFDPNSASTIYAVAVSGTIFKSTDTGQTWQAQCNLNNSTPLNTQLFVSPASDGTAYVGYSSELYRVDALGDQNCPTLTQSISGAVYIQSGTASVAIAPSSGNLYAWERASHGGALYRSTDRGESWSKLIHGINLSPTHRANMAIAPADENQMIMIRQSVGVFRRTSITAPFSAVSGAGFTGLHDSIRYDPVNAGYLYSNAGYYSSDSGATWTADGNYAMSRDWMLDSAGAGYRLSQSGSDTVIQKSANMLTPSWAALAGGTFAGYSTESRVDVNGQNIAALVAGRLYLSADGGMTFTEPEPPGGVPFYFETVDGPNGVEMAAGSEHWQFLTSDNGGVTWNPGYTTNDPGEPPRVRVNPVDAQNVYVHAYEYSGSTYERQRVVSSDGLQTGTTYSDGTWGWSTTTAVSVTHDAIVYEIGNSGSFFSSDGGDTTVTLPGSFPNVWYPHPGFVSPGNTDLLWIVDGYSGSLYEFDRAVDTNLRDETARVAAQLSGEQPAGIHMFDAGGGAYPLQIVSGRGYLAESLDQGMTFTAINTTGGLSNCNRRELHSSPFDRNIIVTACYGSDTGAAWSDDGGVTWTPIYASDWNNYNCYVQGVVVTESVFIFACRDKAPVYVPHTSPTCGDGIEQLPEKCDEGASNSDTAGAICRTNCRLAGCGDGIIDPGEECDDGNRDDSDGCTSACTSCGNSMVTAPEECDLGAANSEAAGAACRTDCQNAGCGDGVLDPGEVCDDGNNLGGDGCRLDCMGLEVCGDGLVDTAVGEGCDDGMGNSDVAADACRTDCTGPRCGDGALDSAEVCDDGNTSNGDTCTGFCSIDQNPEASCTHEDDDYDYIIDEGCGGTPPTPPISSWVAYDFAYYDHRVGCSGARYVMDTGYATGRYVGVILCSPTRYKILLSDDLEGVFYSIGDGCGSGQDHCEFVGGMYTSFDTSNNDGEPGYTRCQEGDTPVFGTMGGAHYSANWYECGVSIP